MRPCPLPTTEPATPATPVGPEIQAQRLREVLLGMCTHLGATREEADRIVEDQCLRLEGVDFALRLNAANQHLEFFGDCGRPEPYEETELHRHLLVEALSNETPSLGFALHPVSGHIVAKGSLFLPAIDEEGWLCTALLLTALTRINELREKFAFAPHGHP